MENLTEKLWNKPVPDDVRELHMLLDMEPQEVFNYVKIKLGGTSGFDQFLFKAGSNPSGICVVAHFDTVWDARNSKKYGGHFKKFKAPKRIVYDPTRRAFYGHQCILGADDRAGIYACLKIHEATGCSVLITNHEEIGALGASVASKHLLDKGVKFFIELDRQGKNEMVFYNHCPQNLKQHLSSFGFQEKKGMFSDIAILTPQLKVYSANVSVGYSHQHSIHEVLKVNWLEQTINKVISIINSGPLPAAKHDPVFDASKFKKKVTKVVADAEKPEEEKKDYLKDLFSGLF